MGIALRCVLKERVPGIPFMEGKSLAAVYCAGGKSGAASNADIILIDFKTGHIKSPSQSASVPEEPLLTPLDPFVLKDGGIHWYNPALGLAAVKDILAKLRKGYRVTVDAAFEFGGDDREVTAGLRFDLENLEQILAAAKKFDTGFCLAFDL